MEANGGWTWFETTCSCVLAWVAVEERGCNGCSGRLVWLTTVDGDD